MMQDTHRSKRNERAQSTNGQRPQGRLRARAAPKSKGFQNRWVVGVLLSRINQLGRAGALDCSPRTGVWGRAPILTPKNFGALLKYLALGIDYDQVKFFGTEAPGLEPPQIDHQLPVSAPQDFLPFLHRFILGLKEDEAPGRLHSDASNGRYSLFSDRAQPLLSSGTPFAGHQARQATDLAPRAITVPIQHFGFQLHQTEGSQSFGPWPLTTPGQADLDLLDFFIQGPQQLHPVLEHLCHPGIHLLTQVAKSLGPPPILQAPIALAQQ